MSSGELRKMVERRNMMTDKSKRNFLKGIFGMGAAATIAVPNAIAKQLEGKSSEEQVALIDALVENGFMKKRTALRWKLQEGHISKEEFQKLYLTVKEFSQEEHPNEDPKFVEHKGCLMRTGKYSIPDGQSVVELKSIELDEKESKKEYNKILKNDFLVDFLVDGTESSGYVTMSDEAYKILEVLKEKYKC